MSATEEQNPILSGQDRADGHTGQAPRQVVFPVAPVEESNGVTGAAAFRASQVVLEAFREEEGGQEVAWPKVEEARDGKQAKQEYIGEGQEEDEDEERNEEEQDCEDEEQDAENVVEDQVVEVKEEGAKVILDGREFSVAEFHSLFRDLVHSLLHRLYHNKRVLVRPNTGRLVVRHGAREPENPREGPTPQEGEGMVEGAENLEGEYPAEGTRVPEESAEGSASQKSEKSDEAKFQKEESLTNAAPFYEMGASAFDGAEACKWQQSHPTLAASVGASVSLAGRAQCLSAVVKQQVSALKKLQVEYAQVEAQFYKDLYSLEKKYFAFNQSLFDKRCEIINAVYEPTEGECQWEGGVQEAAREEMEKKHESKGQTDGIPRFWLTAFKNAKILDRMIGENDELILEHLKDVKVKFSGVEEPMSFTIEFVFKSNEYFFNEVLTKTYQMQSEPDNSNPFLSLGPKIISSTGCEIYWKEGKNVIVNTVKQQKCEGHGSVVPTSRNVPRGSFFTYFYPPESGVLNSTTDYKLGYFFRKVLVPKAILFFINEASEYMFKNFDEEAQEARSEEEKGEDENEELEEQPETDLDPVEAGLGEPSSMA
nr:nucleosome assembly protein 1-like 1 [Microcebus murinus]